MHYVLSGGTSKTGNCVAERLVTKFGAENLTCLVRESSDVAPLRVLGARLHVCDVTQPKTYQAVLSPQTTFVDMSRIRYTHHVLEALQNAGVPRGFFVSTTAIYSKFQSLNALYLENEAKIQNSGLTYTILRPSMIYGSPRDKNMHKLIGFLGRTPIFPLFGGESLMQPVFVDDLADAIVRAVGDEQTANQAYDLAGLQAITYRSIIETIVRLLKRRVKIVNVPPALAENTARLGEKIPGFPLKAEQVLRLREDKAFDISKAVAALNFQPRSFEDGIANEIEQMRKAGLIR